MKPKYLNGQGKGEIAYDFKYDILMFKVKDREYAKSVELHNFVADIDDKGFVTGIRIFDASKVFGVSKFLLKSIKSMKFKASVEDNVITIVLEFSSIVRNKESIYKPSFTTEAGTEMEDAEVECVVA